MLFIFKISIKIKTLSGSISYIKWTAAKTSYTESLGSCASGGYSVI